MPALIDVIVPVYNRAYCLPQMIETLKGQTCKDFRVIFVNDGSTDHSLSVLEDVLRDVPFESLVLSQENGGPAKARNTGLRAATAEYVVFADSDDGLLPEYLDYLSRAAIKTGADVGFCRYQYIPENKKETVPPDPVGDLSFRKISAEEGMGEHCASWLGICGMIVRRSFQVERQIFMDEDCRYMEDAPFLCELIAASSSLVMMEHGLYVYYTHAGSESRSPRVDKFRNGIDCFERTCQRISRLDSDAARLFGRVGPVRYGIATLRKAAVQMPYGSFRQVAEMVQFRRFRASVPLLTRGPRLAARMMLISKFLFYCSVNVLFKD